jgi:hypothetical protein
MRRFTPLRNSDPQKLNSTKLRNSSSSPPPCGYFARFLPSNRFELHLVAVARSTDWSDPYIASREPQTRCFHLACIMCRVVSARALRARSGRRPLSASFHTERGDSKFVSPAVIAVAIEWYNHQPEKYADATIDVRLRSMVRRETSQAGAFHIHPGLEV